MRARYCATGSRLVARAGAAILGRVAAQEDGQTLVEYGILAAVIAIVVVVVAMIIGIDISASFESAIKYF
jgi:Flp pilus assembly pilin Flp